MNKQQIIDTIANTTGVIIGQSIGDTPDYRRFIEPLEKTPALLRGDLFTYTTDPQTAQETTSIMLDH